MDDYILTMVYESLAMWSLNLDRLDMAWSPKMKFSGQDEIISPLILEEIITNNFGELLVMELSEKLFSIISFAH